MSPQMKKRWATHRWVVKSCLPFFGLFLLAQCGTQPSETALAPQISTQNQTSTPPAAAAQPTQHTETKSQDSENTDIENGDLIGSLIAQLPSDAPDSDAELPLGEADNQTALIAAQPDEGPDNQSVTAQAPDSLPQDAQSQAALSAALALLSTSRQQQDVSTGLFSDRLQPASSLSSSDQYTAQPTSADYGLKIGLLLPLTGDFARLGAQIRAGVELALLNARRADVQLAHFDTQAGTTAEQAALAAQEAEVDIILGPLFTAATQKAYPILAEAEIPMLLLGNNQALASPSSWVLGATPEQQLDVLLGAVMTRGTPRIAILTAEDAFGAKMENHLRSRLAQFGLQPARRQLLGQQVLDDEAALRDAIQRFAGYRKPASDEQSEPHPLPFDVIYIAGGPEFVLRTAPVLSYYDASPDRALFIGTDFWAQPALIKEPALQGAIYTQLKMPDASALSPSWVQTGLGPQPDLLGKLGFDATSVILALYAHHRSTQPLSAQKSGQSSGQRFGPDWQKKLVHEKGFNGFSGAFRLLPNGYNQRSYDLQQIADYQSTPWSTEAN